MESVIRFFKDPKASYFLFGPRGTGKSTWTKAHYSNALRIDLLDAETYRAFSAKPERLRENILGNPDQRVVVIDEVQRIPALLGVVHQLIEEKRDIQFVLTGSSARKLKQAGIDLLGGRALIRSFHPFMAAELGNRFDFQEALKTGLLPLVVDSPQSREDILQAYAALYLREEVQIEGLVRNIGNFSRFLEMSSFSHASVLNISNLSRECEVERKVVENYIGILEDLLLAYRLPVFMKRAKREVIAHPKFYLFDAGVFRSLRPSGPLDRPEEIEGGALEGLVAQHLRAWIAYGGQEHTALYFWRSRSGVEVDFIIYGPAGIYALEVKSTARIRSEDLRSLRAFREEYPESKALLLYRGKERLKQRDVLCVPCEEFLRGLIPGQAFA